MRSLQFSRVIFNLVCVLMITACSGRNDVLPTEQVTMEPVEVMQAVFVVSSAAFEWPEVQGSCIGDTLPPKN